MLSAKEAFILEAPSHVYQACFAFECNRIKENLGLYDAVLSFSSEVLNAHWDYFGDYALTLGRSTQGISQFRNNAQAMVDGSKLLSNDGNINRDLADAMDLPSVFTNHGLLHERVTLLCQQLANDLNADYGSLFSEKKYRELQHVANTSQAELLE